MEASLYSDVLGATVHFEWDSGKGRPIFASVEGVDEVLVLGYDDDGNLVDAVEDTGGCFFVSCPRCAGSS